MVRPTSPWSHAPRHGVFRSNSSCCAEWAFTGLWFWLLGLQRAFSSPHVDDSGRPLALFFSGLLLALLLWSSVGTPFTNARARAGTYYGVTNRRILIVWRESFAQKHAGWDLSALPEPRLTHGRDGTDTVSFQTYLQEPWRYLWWSPVGRGTSIVGGTKLYEMPWFDMIENAEAVCAVIRTAQQSNA